MSKYPFNEIEPKWQKYWEENKTFKAEEDPSYPKEKRAYVLDMFPYPSGAGLHVGHPEGYTATDIYSRFLRMNGYNVLHPMGFDSFGLPAENYAIKTGTHPYITTNKNINNFRRQIKSLGFSYDWDREISTCDEDYYKWTQWIFLQLYKKGLAYEAHTPINWCPSCKTGLANEEVKEGRCERCGTKVEKKNIRQWMLKITAYGDRLLKGLDDLDWPESVKTMQRNWIGRSEGAAVFFKLEKSDDYLEVYTTRCDTLFGATYMVIAPEHPLVEKLTTPEQKKAVEEYLEITKHKSDLERTDLAKEKTGVFSGSYAINPINGKKLPIWIADYVLISYGTGAIMAVPAHDERDWEFAKKFNLPIIEVLKSKVDVQEEPWTEDGEHVNSEWLNGLNKKDAIEKCLEYLEEHKCGHKAVNYKLRDWVFSRQRYWGEPIPIVKCEKCGYVAIPESELPLELPEVESYMPTDNGESPLAHMTEWVQTTCPHCGGPALRETDTMPQWAGSSWYFLRYTDPYNDKELASKEALNYWMPVDWYNGGMEHTTLHLLYSRFWHRFLYDEKVVPCPEPYLKRTSHGMILGSNGEKMSKSRGNVVNPDDIVRDYGADTLRTYEMFIGAFELSAAWSEDGVKGCRRFLERVWKLQDSLVDGDEYSKDLEVKMHQTIKKVSNDFESLKYNTAIAAMMALINEFYKKNAVTRGEFKTLLTLLNPVAPHITEEIWQTVGFKGRIYQTTWPEFNESKTVENTVEIAVQINGKTKATLDIARDEDKASVIAKAKETIADKLTGNIVKEIYVPGRIVNLVMK